MESYNSHTSYSSSSSDFGSYPRDNINDDDQAQMIRKTDKPVVPSFLASLHSVRKPMMPKPMLKKPIAPLPPTPPRVYKVDSTNFKQVVQRLTSESQTTATRRLQDVAPPPLNIISTPKLLRSLSNIDSTTGDAVQETTGGAQPPQPSYPSPLAAVFRDLMDENIFDSKPVEGLGDQIASPLGFSLTPNFCSFLNETLDSSKAVTKSSSDSTWGALLSPLGFSNLSPTISNANANTKLSDCFAGLSPLGFSLSPASAAWCSWALASPGALSPIGQTALG